MTPDDQLYRFRQRTLALAEELGNVRAACRVMGIHPSTFYRWRRDAERYGLEMLRPRERRRPRMPNATSPFVEHGYGYPTELVAGDTVSLWTALVNNDTHVTMEIWPAQQEWLEDVEEGTLVDVGQSLDTGWEAWVIPQYVKDANPGLVSVSDIPEYAHLFVTPDSRERARFVTCVPGWACEQVNAAKVTAYGLEEHIHLLNPGSGAGLFADLQASYDRGEPWLGYLWFPTPPAVRLDLYVLEEPPYSDACWAADKACAYPEAVVKIMVNASLPPRAPDVLEFLSQWSFRAADQIEAELWMEENNETPAVGAIWFLRTYRQAWASIVPGEVAERVDEALEAEQ